MTSDPHRVLRIILGFLAVLMAAGGLLLIVARGPLLQRILLHPPEAQVSTLLQVALRDMGGFVLMLALLLYFAARDPVRNRAIVDGLVVGLLVLAVTPVISLYTTDVATLYPAYLVWIRSGVRLLFAVVIFFLRPREGQ